MYIDYQPIINSRRNLNTDSKERNLISEEYFVFYVFAQVGGLYTFLVLLFSLFVNHVTNQTFYHEIINEVHEQAIKHGTEDHQSENLRGIQANKPNMNKVAPNNINHGYTNSRTAHLENDPLIHRYMPKHLSMSNLNNSQINLQRKNQSIAYKNVHAQSINRVNENYEGGEEPDIFARKRNTRQESTNTRYDMRDLIYRIFCCEKSSDNVDRKTISGRNAIFIKQKEIFQKEVDIIRVIATINELKSKID